jgi:hypothetical protein
MLESSVLNATEITLISDKPVPNLLAGQEKLLKFSFYLPT